MVRFYLRLWSWHGPKYCCDVQDGGTSVRVANDADFGFTSGGIVAADAGGDVIATARLFQSHLVLHVSRKSGQLHVC